MKRKQNESNVLFCLLSMPYTWIFDFVVYFITWAVAGPSCWITLSLMNIKLERIWKDPFMAELRYCPDVWLEGAREMRRTSARIDVILTEVWTEQFSDTSLEQYCCAILPSHALMKCSTFRLKLVVYLLICLVTSGRAYFWNSPDRCCNMYRYLQPVLQTAMIGLLLLTFNVM